MGGRPANNDGRAADSVFHLHHEDITLKISDKTNVVSVFAIASQFCVFNNSAYASIPPGPAMAARNCL